MKRAAVVILVLTCILAAGARRVNTTRGKLVSKPEPTVTVAVDTIIPDSGKIVLSGFDKTLRSRHETFMITNHTEQTIRAIGLTLDYTDTHARQLHRRTVEVRCTIPPEQTRTVNIPTWDKQGTYYYYLTVPPRASSQASPFKVKSQINYVLAL